MTSYEERLRIPHSGDDHTRFETSTGLHVATGYTRAVIGGRGRVNRIGMAESPGIFNGAQFKFQVSLDAAKGTKTINELATEHSLHPNQISQWKRQLLGGQSRMVDYADSRVGIEECSTGCQICLWISRPRYRNRVKKKLFLRQMEMEGMT